MSLRVCCLTSADKIRAKFPSTFGRPGVSVEVATKAVDTPKKLKIGVVLSGGQVRHADAGGRGQFAKARAR